MEINNNIVCYCTELERFYYSPIVLLDNNIHNGDYLNLYTFIGKAPYTVDELSVPEMTLSPTYIKNVYKHIIFMKKVNLNDISVVAERIDWTANTFYDIYHQDANMSERGSDGKLIKKFYVKNKYDQIFKCLWNNITDEDTYSVSNIINNDYYYSIEHQGGTFEIGSYITLTKTNPDEFTGTYKVIGSTNGIANVSFGTSSAYVISTEKQYVSGGLIKSSVLSTEEPVFQPGSYEENNLVETSDGYKWIYLTTLDKGKKLKFYDKNWMPIGVDANYPNPSTTDSGWGSIDTINIVNGGQGYANGTNTVIVTVTGDGNGARAEAFVSNNKISKITMLNYGKDYTFANVSITPASGYSGSGVEAQLSISTIGGHGFNLVRDLYCRNIMVTSSFEGTEQGSLPTNIFFNQIGLIYNPYLVSDQLNHANSSIINCMTEVIVYTGDSPYIHGESVYQGISLSESTFSAEVLSFDSSNNILQVINTKGTIKENYELKGETSGVSRVVNGINYSSYIPNSGNIFYLENKLGIERDNLGTEQTRILIRYG